MVILYCYLTSLVALTWSSWMHDDFRRADYPHYLANMLIIMAWPLCLVYHIAGITYLKIKEMLP